MKKYIIYARVASRKQADRNSSITSQVETLKALANEIDVEVVDIFTEIGSTSQNRKEFNKMMNKLFNGEADGILCTSLDRLSRTALDYYKIVLAIDSKGIFVITPSQVYSRDAEKKFLMNLEVSLNTFCNALVSQRIKAGISKGRIKSNALLEL